MRYSLRSLMVVVTLVGISLAGWRVVASFCVRTEILGFRVRVQELPENDDALAEWIRAQPGVSRASVGRKNGNIEVVMIMNRDMNGNPPAPPLRDSMARFQFIRVDDIRQVYP